MRTSSRSLSAAGDSAAQVGEVVLVAVNNLLDEAVGTKALKVTGKPWRGCRKIAPDICVPLCHRDLRMCFWVRRNACVLLWISPQPTIRPLSMSLASVSSHAQF